MKKDPRLLPEGSRSLVWNADLSLDNFNTAVVKRQEAIAKANAKRPRTALLEREIMVAVTALYIIILGGFALLHVYAAWYVEENPAAVQTDDRH